MRAKAPPWEACAEDVVRRKLPAKGPRRSAIRVARRLLLGALAALLCMAPAQLQASEAWWDEAWRYRLIVRVPPPGLRAGINTARLDLAEQAALCAEAGRDVRVVDERGTSVPHKVSARGDGRLEVKFLVPPQAEVFFVYYGNPQAAAVAHDWQEQPGGLTLETRALPRPEHRASRVGAVLAGHLQSFGKQPWGQINDLENPFGRDDLYVSIYEGTLYCPEDGAYTFAVNADDLACFYLERDGTVLLYCWRNAGVPSNGWRDKSHPDAVKTTGELPRGVYRIRYYHVENGGAQLAKLGWQVPSSDQIVTVPPRAFVNYLPAEIQGRQVRGEALNPFFIARHRYNLEVNSELVFPCHRFESRSGEADQGAAALSYRWEFGDGSTGAGRVVEHEFPDMRPYEVTLTVRDPEGREERVTRPVPHPPEPLKRMTLRMQVEFEREMPLLRPGATAWLRVLVKNESEIRRDVVLETVAERLRGGRWEAETEAEPLAGLEPAAGIEDRWIVVRKIVPLGREDLRLTLRLLIHDRAAIQTQMVALSTDGPLGELAQDQAHNLRDAQGRIVVLRLADVTMREVPARIPCDEATGKVRVLVIDEGLGGPVAPGATGHYVQMLVRRLNERYAPLEFVADRPPIPVGEEYPPVRRFLEILRHVREARPHMVLLVCQPESAVNTEPPAVFEAYLVAAVDRILSQTRAHVILVTPPPLPGRPESARTYARIAKKTGLRKGLVVADLYSRFLLTEQWQELFKAQMGQRPSYLLYPNLQGQRVVSEEISASIIARLDGELSAAARRASRRRRMDGP